MRNNLSISEIRLIPILNIPLIKENDHIAEIIFDNTIKQGVEMSDDDIIVIASKIISKSENSIVRLNDIKPSKEANEIASKTGRTPEICQVYLNEASEIFEIVGRMVITRHKLGFVGTNSFVDRSNISKQQDNLVVTLPKNPDKSAFNIRSFFKEKTGFNCAVIIVDSFGQANRKGSHYAAIGISGIRHLEEKEGQDLYGNKRNSVINLIDQISGAAGILMGETNESIPVVIVKGVQFSKEERSSIKNIIV